MTMTLDEFQGIQKRIEHLKGMEARLRAELNLVRRKLQEEFGTMSMKEAETKLKKMRDRVEELQLRLTKEKARFQKEWEEDLR